MRRLVSIWIALSFFSPAALCAESAIRPNSYPSISGCRPFLGHPRRPLKFIFVNLNNAPYFGKEVRRIVYRELKRTAPFSRNFRRMVFYRAALRGDFDCAGSPRTGFGCSDAKVLQALSKVCQADDWRGIIIIAVAKSAFGGRAGPVIYLGERSDPAHFRRGRRRGVHEIAHLFGLADLDPGIDTGEGKPTFNWKPLHLNRRDWNVDGAGCAKWCAAFKPIEQYTASTGAACLRFADRAECLAFNRSPQGWCTGACCVWSQRKFAYFGTRCVPLAGTEDIGLGCRAGTGCYFGANYGHYAWRPAAQPNDSLMWYLTASRFDPVSADMIQKVFTCCLSRQAAAPDCTPFRRAFTDYLAQNRRLGLKSRIGSCGKRRSARGTVLR